MKLLMSLNQGLWMSFWLIILAFFILAIILKKIKWRKFEATICEIQNEFKITPPKQSQLLNVNNFEVPVQGLYFSGYLTEVTLKIHGIKLKEKFRIENFNKISINDRITVTYVCFFKNKFLMLE